MKPEPFSSAAGDQSLPPPMLEAARAWIARRDAGFAPTERVELQSWLAADARHRRAFAAADAKRSDVDWALHAGAVEEVLTGLSVRARRRRRRGFALGGMAAALAIVVGYSLYERDDVAAGGVEVAQPASSTSGTLTVIEPRRVELPDGSHADLRGDAELALDFTATARRVALVRGIAHFDVVRDPARPFMVRSSDIEVLAVGTAFAVERADGRIEVLVTEGKVSVTRERVGPAADWTAAPEVTPVMLGAGNRVIVSTAAGDAAEPVVERMDENEMRERLEWRVPRLQFAGTPLREVVAAMNRHNRVQFVIADPALGDLLLSGALRADKTEALQAMLLADFRLRTERDGDRIILRRGP